jgi:hypothetical protein
MKYRSLSVLVLVLLSLGLSAQSYIDRTFTEYFRRTGPGWIASDGTISILLPDGKVLWLFGDTYIDDYHAADTSIPCLFQIRNSMLVQDAHDRSKFITIIDSTQTGVNRTPVKAALDDSTVLWPGHGFVKGDTAYVFWFRYHGKSLVHYGNYYTKIYWPGLTSAKAIISLVKLPEMAGKEFGNAVIAGKGNEFVYIYGRGDHGKVYLTRFPWNHLFSRWEYYNGSGWVENASEAVSVSDFDVSPSFSVISHKNKYYVISQENGYLTCGMGRVMFSLSADSPTGPFKEKKVLYTMEDKYKDSYLITYNGTAHPEFNSKNELLISYNVNDKCPGSCQFWENSRWNADLYRPKFVRVPFSVFEEK